MKESIYKYFQIGTIQWMSHPDYKVLDSIHRITCDEFFNAIEVCHFADNNVREEAKALIDQSHMKVCFGAQPSLLGTGLNPNAINEDERVKAEKILIKCVDEADYLGAKAIAFLSGHYDEQTKDIAYKQLLKTTSNVCKYAQTKGMGVNLEVFDFDMDKKALIGPAPYAAKFAADMRCTCSNFGLMVDLSHFPTTYETSRFVIQVTKPFIKHLHIGNAVVEKGCQAYGDQHPRFGYPNSANDTAELVDFFKILKEEGLFRENEPLVLSMEVKPWKDEDAEIILANTKRVINRAWAILED